MTKNLVASYVMLNAAKHLIAKPGKTPMIAGIIQRGSEAALNMSKNYVESVERQGAAGFVGILLNITTIECAYTTKDEERH